VERESGALKNRNGDGTENVDNRKETPKMNIDPSKNKTLVAALMKMALAKARKIDGER
jgi:hypothetical protein